MIISQNLALGFDEDLRDYHIAAQILKYFNIEHINLLSNQNLMLNLQLLYHILAQLIHMRVICLTILCHDLLAIVSVVIVVLNLNRL
jgi:3,4-dihydroxy 2-butanone 4-phosphate synthase/GTP cyclohydrolase II